MGRFKEDNEYQFFLIFKICQLNVFVLLPQISISILSFFS